MASRESARSLQRDRQQEEESEEEYQPSQASGDENSGDNGGDEISHDSDAEQSSEEQEDPFLIRKRQIFAKKVANFRAFIIKPVQQWTSYHYAFTRTKYDFILAELNKLFVEARGRDWPQYIIQCIRDILK